MLYALLAVFAISLVFAAYEQVHTPDYLGHGANEVYVVYGEQYMTLEKALDFVTAYRVAVDAALDDAISTNPSGGCAMTIAQMCGGRMSCITDACGPGATASSTCAQTCISPDLSGTVVGDFTFPNKDDLIEQLNIELIDEITYGHEAVAIVYETKTVQEQIEGLFNAVDTAAIAAIDTADSSDSGSGRLLECGGIEYSPFGDCDPFDRFCGTTNGVWTCSNGRLFCQCGD